MDKVTFDINWIAQAKHGGFYQVIGTGIYTDHDLDVSIKIVGSKFPVVLNC
ncbi:MULTISPECIES: hypothetical protein [unclassified Nostoc]|uniref:hypothetical protein n=1 Tax=unclassified Nostoc TaxID=2593658 RepID=UPI0015E2FCA7|nr:hypothetical protein [Nostoc sp. 'Peltigera membranacea cyanobiont' N6]